MRVLPDAVDIVLMGLACFGVIELCVLLAAMFIAPTEFDWEDDE